jgi:hypothetical protein
MNFSLIKGSITIANTKLVYKPKVTILKQLFIKKVIIDINSIKNITIRKQVNALFLEIDTHTQNLALLFEKQVKTPQIFIAKLKEINPTICIIERLSQNQNFCHESCCYYKNE